MQQDPYEIDATPSVQAEVQEHAAKRAGLNDVDVRQLISEAGRTWQVLQHDLDSQYRRPRA